jgi:hypothetical protein
MFQEILSWRLAESSTEHAVKLGIAAETGLQCRLEQVTGLGIHAAKEARQADFIAVIDD